MFLVETENKVSDFRKITCAVHQGPILRPFCFIFMSMICLKQKNEIFYCILIDDSYLSYQHKDIAEKKTQRRLCGWSADNKLSIHFRDYETKSILFASKQSAKNIRKLNI